MGRSLRAEPSGEGRRHAQSGVPPDGRAVELRGITKSFYGVAANVDVDFDLEWGEVHALLGENGAGKTTLCSVLAGLYRPEAGTVSVAGIPVDFRAPRDALDHGVGMVYQHFRLVPKLTVAENLALGHPAVGLRLSRRRIERDAAALGERYGLRVDPTARIWELSVGEQQRVEILKLLYRDVRVLILDEPTAVLTPQEVEALFGTLEVMADEGRAVVFVSHKLDEVTRICDRVSVLRDGRHIGTVATAEADPRALARMMVGHDVELPERTTAAEPGAVALGVRGLGVLGERGLPAVVDVDLEVRRGEIVGVAGVAGNGQRELVEAIAGMRTVTGGSVALDGVDVSASGPRGRRAAGLAFVPEDRLGTGLASGLPVEDNLALGLHRAAPFSRGPLLSRRAIRQRSVELTARFDVRGVRPGLPVRLLSGGNLQKALLARELSDAPRVLVAAGPTRGLDVAATAAVRQLLLEQRDAGTAVLLVSEDLDEILGLADRILVIYEGRIVGELAAAAADRERLGLLMAGRTAETP